MGKIFNRLPALINELFTFNHSFYIFLTCYLLFVKKMHNPPPTTFDNFELPPKTLVAASPNLEIDLPSAVHNAERMPLVRVVRGVRRVTDKLASLSLKQVFGLLLKLTLAQLLVLSVYGIIALAWIQARLNTKRIAKVPTQTRLATEALRPLIQQHGNSALAYSFMTNPEFHHFYVEGLGCIVYCIAQYYNRSLTIAVGDPLAARQHWPALHVAFLAQFPHASFWHASEEYAGFLSTQGFFINRFGTETTIDIRDYHTHKISTNLRKSIRRAQNAGYLLREIKGADLDPNLVDRLHEISRQWQGSRKGGQRHLKMFFRNFSVTKEELSADGARLFVVQRSVGGQPQVDAFMLADPMFSNGQISGYVPTLAKMHPHAHPETLKFMQSAVLRQLDAEGCRQFALGISPLYFSKPSPYQGMLWFDALCEFSYRFGSQIYAAKSLAFAKLRHGGELRQGRFSNPAVTASQVYIAHRSGWVSFGALDLFVVLRFIGTCGPLAEVWRLLLKA